MQKKSFASLLFLSFFIVFVTNITSFAQTASSTWVVKNPPYAERNHASLIIDRVELTPTYTIVGFIFDNRAGEATLISICNSFKIMANHKKVAKIIKTVGIPMADVSKEFRCAELPDAMQIRKGQIVKFDLYFTPIPKDVEYIDLVEYNTKESCEYDVFEIDIRQKKKTNPKKVQEMPVNPPIADTSPFKKIPIPPSLNDKERDKLVQALKDKLAEQKRQNKEKAAKKDKTPPVVAQKTPVKTPEPEPTKKEEPTVSVKTKAIEVKTREVNIEIWDNDKEDGDIVSLKLNGKWILQNREVKKEPYKLKLSLSTGENILIMQAENLGTRGNNTAAIRVDDGISPPQTSVLNSDMGKSEAIKINVQ